MSCRCRLFDDFVIGTLFIFVFSVMLYEHANSHEWEYQHAKNNQYRRTVGIFSRTPLGALPQLPDIHTATFNSSPIPASFGTKKGSFESSQSGEHGKNVRSLTAMTQHLPPTNLMHIRCVAIKRYTWSYCVKYRFQIHRIEPPRSNHTGVTTRASGLTFIGSSRCGWERRKEV